MKCLIVILAVAVAVKAKPFFGLDLGGLGGYGSGGSYGDSGYGGGHHGYRNQGYGSNIFRTGHDIGGARNDYDASIHHHQSAFHNRGGMMEGSSGGHNILGYGGYNHGHNDFGSGWNNGYY